MSSDIAALSLTSRENEVLASVMLGQNNTEIAANLFISVNTVKFHVHNVLRKLGARSRTEAAVIATRIIHSEACDHTSEFTPSTLLATSKVSQGGLERLRGSSQQIL
ncbi:hypothetical protein CH299_27950 [Rhodococcus sp. 14-2686-1-2]|nr:MULTISPECIES: helix-turn-helix transcriptional regulator [unclassified Rhodococcus (in: high G+C Gram-positive bacteria)]OZE93185.1 hypothetical protein CH301_27430 [Rhodococcus sp. 15-1189-1-1a]OZF08303.1 hypothetical protein CH299_27950 [Rhodococcus sp. 14-2686-1-2]